MNKFKSFISSQYIRKEKIISNDFSANLFSYSLLPQLTCCGVESIRDWEIRIQDAFEKRLRNQTIPISCCWQPHQKVKYFCTATEAYKDTCLSRALFYLHRYVMNTSRVMTIIFCLQVNWTLLINFVKY